MCLFIPLFAVYCCFCYLFVSFSQFICVINAWQERILSCTWTRAHISSLIFCDPCINSLVFLRLLCHSILLAYSWKFNQLLKLTSFYLLKLIFACGLTRISVSKNAAITQLTRDLPNCQEYVMTSLVLWIHGFFCFFVFFARSGFLGVDRRLTKAEDKSGVTETGNRAWKVSGTPRVGASLPLKWAALYFSNASGLIRPTHNVLFANCGAIRLS